MIMPTERKVRSFIAIPVSDAGIQALNDAVRSLETEIGRHVRWVRPEGIHLTLKFMGDIQLGIAQQVLEALPSVAAAFMPFELAIKELGAFPNLRCPRVLWAGVNGDLEVLSSLQQAVKDSVERLGLPKEQRYFSPHLTLGRVGRDVDDGQRRNIGEAVSSVATPAVVRWTADTVNLMRTELDAEGSKHYLVGSASLGSG